MASASESSLSWLDQAAPDFEVATTEGRTQRLIDYRGRPLLFGFFPLAFTGG
jgi:peroxiredoxin